MTISIIIPVYNSEDYLSECLESIQKQTFKDFEVILINDGSTDRSETICKQFSDTDSRFHLYTQPNSGASSARNTGIELSNAEYITFIDADDWVESDYIQKIITAQELNPTDLKIWGFVIGKPDVSQEYHIGSTVCANPQECLKTILGLKQKHKYGFTVQFLYKKSIIDKNGIRFPENIRLHEDMIFANSYCKYIHSLQTIDFLGYHYVDHGTISLSNHFLTSDQCLKIAKTMFESASHWKTYDNLYLFESRLYIGYLSMSVVNMYKEEEIRQRSQRIERILFVKSKAKEIPNLAMTNLPKIRKYALRYLPAFMIDLLYIINVK